MKGAAAERLREAALRGLLIPLLYQEKVDRLAVFVDGTIQRAPLVLDFAVRLVHPPTDVHRPLAARVKRLCRFTFGLGATPALTDRGRAVIRKMTSLGMLVDITHCNVELWLRFIVSLARSRHRRGGVI